MLLAQPTQPIHMMEKDVAQFYRKGRRVSRSRCQSQSSTSKVNSNESKTYLWPFSSTLSRTPIRRKSSTKSSSVVTIPASQPLRLADVAKQHIMATHVDNWREDMLPIQQYLPLQHIIGSLRRELDEPWSGSNPSPELSPSLSITEDTCLPPDSDSSCHESNPETPVSTTDSFLELLQTPKSIPFSSKPDFDRRFSYQAPDHIPKDISQAALPGLNMAINLATITPEERNLFSEYAPKELDDPQILMDEVRRLREFMMSKNDEDDSIQDKEGVIEEELSESEHIQAEADMTKDFDTFVDYQ